jgi:hypothetical protein
LKKKDYNYAITDSPPLSVIQQLLAQFNQIKKKENETVKEFDTRFDKLYDQISTDLHPPAKTVHVPYINVFE